MAKENLELANALTMSKGEICGKRNLSVERTTTETMHGTDRYKWPLISKRSKLIASNKLL